MPFMFEGRAASVAIEDGSRALQRADDRRIARSRCVLASALAGLLVGGCESNSPTDDAFAGGALLPLSVDNAAGEPFRAGSYEVATGEFWLTPGVADGLRRSVAGTDFEVVLARAGESVGDVDLEFALGYLPAQLRPGTSLMFVGASETTPGSEIGGLAIREPAWRPGHLESSPVTSFRFCEPFVGPQP